MRRLVRRVQAGGFSRQSMTLSVRLRRDAVGAPDRPRRRDRPNRQSAIGNRQSPIANRQSAIGNRQSAIADRQLAIGNHPTR